MTQVTTSRIRSYVSIGMFVVLLSSLIVWLLGRDAIPREILIATGSTEGLYHKFGAEIKESLEKRLERKVTLVETDGSAENFSLLSEKKVDLAIIQGGSAKIQDVRVITPIFPEFAFVVARKGSGITSVYDLAGRRVSLGADGSGNLVSARKILEHFNVEQDALIGETQLSFDVMSNDETIDAAIVIAGVEHPNLQKMLLTNQFDIVPLRSAAALDMKYPFARAAEIPRGLFAEDPPVPSESTPTIATTAFLVCREKASSDLVQATLAAIHEGSLRLEVPTLIDKKNAQSWTVTEMHPTAKRYFNPEDNIGVMVNILESIVATKELLFAIGAGIYLLWIRWRRMEERELAAQISEQKERLDIFLMETLRIEREQATTTDFDELKGFLDTVTSVKLQAIQELTEEDLRGNQEFAIFLDQCSHLIGRIQRKMYRIDPNANI
ncbi:MAG: TAXI family TRAP transporter solute-binding subunit [Rubripirellula sp.]|nr:TAXI family TRAP transporter solute-binding subunit [Rubripirellula sp.]